VPVTAAVIRRLWVRRARCCGRSHALLPGFVTWGRLDAGEVIGSAVAAMCAGVGLRRVAERLDLGHTTVRVSSIDKVLPSRPDGGRRECGRRYSQGDEPFGLRP
jgi:hypothetical protein